MTEARPVIATSGTEKKRTIDESTLASLTGVPVETVRAVRGAAKEGEILLLGLSGKLLSGKDSIARGVCKAMNVADAQHYYFADTVKNETDDVIEILKRRTDTAARMKELAQKMEIGANAAQAMITLLTDEVERVPELNARMRTNAVRAALQYWGASVRRVQDSEYFVKRSLRDAIVTASSGKSVYYTDIRFPNEVEYAQAAGFFVARLEISPETQLRRLQLRDGLDADTSTLNHVSETILDEYIGFDLHVRNEGRIDETVHTICQALRKQRNP